MPIEPGKTNLANLDCSICHHDPEKRAICSACRPEHCHGCWKRDITDLQTRVKQLEEQVDWLKDELASDRRIYGGPRPIFE